MNLLDLRKYAVDHRVSIKFGDPYGARECVINERGQVRIPGENKDFRIEDALSAAENFSIIANGDSINHTRESMTKVLSEAAGKNKPGAAEEEEE
jgi:hypothetical protein